MHSYNWQRTHNKRAALIIACKGNAEVYSIYQNGITSIFRTKEQLCNRDNRSRTMAVEIQHELEPWSRLRKILSEE